MKEASPNAGWENDFEMEPEYDFSKGIPNPFAERASQQAFPEPEPTMRDEYDFSNAEKNPYVQRFQELNLVSLDPDVKAVFPDSASVNAALRLLIKAAKDVKELSKVS